MSEVLCSQVLWTQVFNLLWFNTVYWEGERMREAGTWAERLRWFGKGKARANHPIWCSQADCCLLVIFAWWKPFQRRILQISIAWWAAELAPFFSLLWAVVLSSFPISNVLILFFLCICEQYLVLFCFQRPWSQPCWRLLYTPAWHTNKHLYVCTLTAWCKFWEHGMVWVGLEGF